jgi:hypothetical protein
VGGAPGEAGQAPPDTGRPPPPAPSPAAPPREVVVVEGSSPRRLRALLEAYAAAVARARRAPATTRSSGTRWPPGASSPMAWIRGRRKRSWWPPPCEAGLPEREAREAARWGLRVGQGAPLDLGDSDARGTLLKNPFLPSWTAKPFWSGGAPKTPKSPGHLGAPAPFRSRGVLLNPGPSSSQKPDLGVWSTRVRNPGSGSPSPGWGGGGRPWD